MQTSGNAIDIALRDERSLAADGSWGEMRAHIPWTDIHSLFEELGTNRALAAIVNLRTIATLDIPQANSDDFNHEAAAAIAMIDGVLPFLDGGNEKNEKLALLIRLAQLEDRLDRLPKSAEVAKTALRLAYTLGNDMGIACVFLTMGTTGAHEYSSRLRALRAGLKVLKRAERKPGLSQDVSILLWHFHDAFTELYRAKKKWFWLHQRFHFYRRELFAFPGKQLSDTSIQALPLYNPR